MTAPSTDDIKVSDMVAPAEDAREHADFLATQGPLDTAAATWLVRRQDGLTAEEEAEFQAWLAANPAHQAALDKLSGLWGRLDDLPPSGIDALRAGLHSYSGQPGSRRSPHAAQPAPHAARQPERRPASQATTPSPAQAAMPGRRVWLFGIGRLVPQAAMAAFAFAVVGGGWLGWEHWQQQPLYNQSFATVRGQLQEVKLPDGSRLLLDTATRAEVTLYRQRREVRLSEGQAMFTVQGDANRPFDVLAGPLRITVVGTRFSVRHTQTGLVGGGGQGDKQGDGQGGVSVVVEEGRVRVAQIQGSGTDTIAVPAEADSPAIELTAGQSVSTDMHGRLAAVTRLTAEAAMPWREGRVNFDDTPLVQALAEFERYVDTRFVVNDPAVAAMRLNGSFDLRQFKVFTRALPQVLPVRLRLRPDGVTEVERAG